MPPSDPSTRAYLHVHGIGVSPDELGLMVREAVDQLPVALVPERPAAGLSRHEAATLERGGFDLEPADSDRVLAETVAELAALLRTSLTTAEAASQLGVNPSRIRQRVGSKPRTLYGVRASRGWRFPAFQFEDDGLVPGMEEVVAALDPELDLVSVYRWITTACPDLRHEDRPAPLSPLTWLRLRLPVEPVVSIAASL